MFIVRQTRGGSQISGWKLLCDILDHDRSKKGTILNFSRVSETNRHLHVHLSKEHAHVKKTVLLKAAVSYDKNSLSI